MTRIASRFKASLAPDGKRATHSHSQTYYPAGGRPTQSDARGATSTSPAHRKQQAPIDCDSASHHSHENQLSIAVKSEQRHVQDAFELELKCADDFFEKKMRVKTTKQNDTSTRMKGLSECARRPSWLQTKPTRRRTLLSGIRCPNSAGAKPLLASKWTCYSPTCPLLSHNGVVSHKARIFHSILAQNDLEDHFDELRKYSVKSAACVAILKEAERGAQN